MASFRNYPNSGAAHSDAAYLRAMGLDAVVFEDGAVGGGVLSASRGSVRIELPEAQLDEAEELMREREIIEPEPPIPETRPTSEAPLVKSLGRLLRVTMVINLVVLVALIEGWGFGFQPPLEIQPFLYNSIFNSTLYLEYRDWDLPISLMGIAACCLCLFHTRLGRGLYFAWTFLWIFHSVCGPALILPPFSALFYDLHSLLSYMAIPLMFWSPLAARFDGPARTS